MSKNNIIEKIQLFLFLSVIYLMCTRIKNKYDEIIIILLGIVTVSKNFYYKKYFFIEKKIIYSVFFWMILMSFSFFKMLERYPNGEYIILYRNAMIDCFLLFFILTQIDLKSIFNENKFLNIINILSIYSIYKGIVFIKSNGLFIRGYAWGNPNYYSMLLGIFGIISFICFLFEKNKVYKILYLILNTLQLFMFISIGQSRNVFLALIINYVICIFLYYLKNKERKQVLKVILVFICIILLAIFILKSFNYRVIDISVEKFINNPRILIWKKALFDEKFNIFFGKGFAYYTMNKFKDSVGVTIWALHNDSLEFLVTQGIFSMVLYLGFILYFMKSLLCKFLHNSDKMILISLILVFYFFMIGMLDLAFYQKRISQFVFLFLGLNIYKEKRNV